ncbi:hypothetical protein L596_022412 [Steinernema carpocapsae]|uniref:DUF38 domain-containing protein n=1 Tax=Steinernema carpocapsae TaxID=34508 RepID=A0A4U5MLP0_STECR|nr:hypothetical protein L596_022412 [Steinernema carpocapsae]
MDFIPHEFAESVVGMLHFREWFPGGDLPIIWSEYMRRYICNRQDYGISVSKNPANTFQLDIIDDPGYHHHVSLKELLNMDPRYHRIKQFSLKQRMEIDKSEQISTQDFLNKLLPFVVKQLSESGAYVRLSAINCDPLYSHVLDTFAQLPQIRQLSISYKNEKTLSFLGKILSTNKLSNLTLKKRSWPESAKNVLFDGISSGHIQKLELIHSNILVNADFCAAAYNGWLSSEGSGKLNIFGKASFDNFIKEVEYLVDEGICIDIVENETNPKVCLTVEEWKHKLVMQTQTFSMTCSICTSV